MSLFLTAGCILFHYFSCVFVVGKSGDDIFISYQHFRGMTLKRLCKSREQIQTALQKLSIGRVT